jgi:triphosphoribosyl-dephospho-CoA synthase
MDGEDGIDVAAAAQLACLLEACAPKPGNVSPGRHFADSRFEDFLASAASLGGPLSNAGVQPLGTTVRRGVEATRRWTRSNTNLGIVLLLTPIAAAARGCGVRASGPSGSRDRAIENGHAGVSSGGRAPADGSSVRPLDRSELRECLRRVLEATTVEDAREVYAAIRIAAPGGLGRSDAQDVAGDPTLPLVEVMRIAAARDGIAREYATAFAVTFEDGAPALDGARRDGLDWDDAVAETFVTLLSRRPDTHIARRAGGEVAREVTRRAADAVRQGGVRTDAGRRTIEAMDRALRDARNAANPGTTADLTAAAINVVLLSGGWRRP